MKKIIPFSLVASMATAGILHYISPAQALTWTFSYESNLPFNYGTQSGTFEAPGSESDGVHNITQFQFTHNNPAVGASGAFNAPNPPSNVFSTADSFTNEITISGGAVTGVSLLVNNTTAPSSISIDFSNTFFDAVDIFDAVDRGGNNIDQSDFSGITFTRQTGAGADYEHNPAPAVLIIGVLFAIKKLRSLLRDKNNSNKASESDSSLKGASETGQ